MEKWPADSVERRPIAGLIPYARNARTHSEAQVAQIAASMREWGWTNPVLVDEAGGIIAGHGRVLAARLLGFDEAPVMVAAGWSEAKKRAYVIADNQIATNASWNFDLLKGELDELDAWGFPTQLVGFDEAFRAALSAEGIVDPEAEWGGMPSYENEDKTSYKSIVVHFKTQADVDRFAEVIGQSILNKTRSIWFPEAEIERYADKDYVDGAATVSALYPEQGAARVHDDVAGARSHGNTAPPRRRGAGARKVS